MGSDIYFKTIQLMLAPAVMISACGLLLLGISNKYSAITNRMRLMSEERRRHLYKIKEGKELDYLETTRLHSVIKQLGELLVSARRVRNVISSYVIGLFLFILTSLIIGLDIFLNVKVTETIALITFIAGMLSVGNGLVFLLLETLKGFKIIEVEAKLEE
ncbi:MAG: DUF2721 domain-containing protein [Ignavibacteria bacterium]|nr:DUF2721 domain-containing protein [Ignavibacteria bacterium]